MFMHNIGHIAFHSFISFSRLTVARLEIYLLDQLMLRYLQVLSSNWCTFQDMKINQSMIRGRRA